MLASTQAWHPNPKTLVCPLGPALRQQRLNARALIVRIHLRAIGSRAAVYDVNHAVAGFEPVISGLALKLIRAAAADERVVAVAAHERVVAAVALEDVGRAGADDATGAAS